MREPSIQEASKALGTLEQALEALEVVAKLGRIRKRSVRAATNDEAEYLFSIHHVIGVAALQTVGRLLSAAVPTPILAVLPPGRFAATGAPLATTAAGTTVAKERLRVDDPERTTMVGGIYDHRGVQEEARLAGLQEPELVRCENEHVVVS